MSPQEFAVAWRGERERLRDFLEQHLQRNEELVQSLLASGCGSMPNALTESAVVPEVVPPPRPAPADRVVPPLWGSNPQFIAAPRSVWAGTSASKPDTPATSGELTQVVPCEARAAEEPSTPTRIRRAATTTMSAAKEKRKQDVQRFLDEDAIAQAGMQDGQALAMLEALVERWQATMEPARSGCLHRCIYNKYFDAALTALILANTLFTTFQAHHEIRNLGEKVAGNTEVEGFFAIVFTVELVMKLCVHRFYFFINQDMKWNIFDTVLVCFSLSDFIVSLTEASSTGSVSFLRALRILKIAKVLRVFRALRFLKELRMMINSIVGSIMSLGWSMLMLGMILHVFALFFVQQMTMHLLLEEMDGSGDAEFLAEQRYYFGGIGNAITSLAMCTTGGKDWEEIYLLIEPLGWFSVLIFSFYLAFYTVAVMNILTGLFVERAMSLCQPDEAERFATHQKVMQDAKDELTFILETLDVDGSECLRLEEFVLAAKNDRIIHALSSLGFDVKDAERVFQTVSAVTGESEVTISNFVRELMRLRGSASSLELYGLAVKLDALQEDIGQLRTMNGFSTPAYRRRSNLLDGQVQDAAPLTVTGCDGARAG